VAHSERDISDLREALDALYSLVGKPSDRQLETCASQAGLRLPRATANTVRRSRGVPRWETIEAFVAACQHFARKHKPPISISMEYIDLPLWRKRYDALTDAVTAAHANNTRSQTTRSTQLPRSWNRPTRLLDPGVGLIEFTGRTVELHDLLAWCIDGAAGKLRLITGPGGIGKTRLALQLTRRLEEQHWHCTWVADRHEAHVLADIRVKNPGPVLVVVDYAETRIGLEELLRGAAADGGLIRVLLLARSAGQWWEQLALGEGAIRDLVGEAEPKGIRLGKALDDHVKDEEVVQRAVPVFAAALGVTPPDHVAVVAQANGARILELHAAALVAVLEWIEDPKEEPVVRLGGVFEELLQHEGRFWQGSARVQGLMDGPNGLCMLQLRQVVAAGCLLGAGDQEEATALLGRVQGVPPSVKLVTWLREMYPPGDDSTEWLGAMQPDRLAERLVVMELSRSAALTRACLSDLGERQARRAVLLLARAATEHDIAERLLRRLLPLVAQVIEDIDAPLETLVSIANAIPYPSMVLGSAHDVVTRRILEAPVTTDHPAERARWLTIRGLTLAQLGRPAEALPVTQEAVGLYRDLTSRHPERYRSELAASLAHLGIGLSELGRAAEALAATQESGRLYRELASANPSRYLHSLAATITNIGVRFSEAGQPAEALQAAEEATRLYRQLAHTDPGRHQPDLAATLTNLGARLSEMKCSAKALEVTQEATRLYRQLAEANPDRHQPDLAATLANLGARLSEIGRPAQALIFTQDALGLLQDRTISDPDRYRPNVAGFLASIGAQFLDLGQPDEALSAECEALRIYRELARTNPAWYGPNLADILAKMGNTLSTLKCHVEALEATQEAVNLYTGLASANPGRYRAELAASLMSLGSKFSNSGYFTDALSVEREAIGHYRELTNASPARYQPDLAISLMIVGARFSDLGNAAAALSVEREAISVYRDLADSNPDWYRPSLALSLMVLGAQLSDSGRLAEALPPEEEAVSLYRDQAATNPRQYRPSLAASLTGLGFRLSDLGRPSEALAAIREAVGLYREKAPADTHQKMPEITAFLASLESGVSHVSTATHGAPDAPLENRLFSALQQAKDLYGQLTEESPGCDRPDLALSLVGLSAKFSGLGQPAEALSAAQEAVRLYRELTRTDPHWYQPNLALALAILGDQLSALDRRTDALSAAQEIVSLYRELALANPGRYLPILANSLNDLGFKFSDLECTTEALAATREAVVLYRKHEAAPTDFTPPATVSRPLDGATQTLEAAWDSVRLYKTLTAISPDDHRRVLARALINLGMRLWDVNRPSEALPVRQEAVSLYRELADTDYYRYRSDLANALADLARNLAKLGKEQEATKFRTEAEEVRGI
jgi:hypothetical protein